MTRHKTRSGYDNSKPRHNDGAQENVARRTCRQDRHNARKPLDTENRKGKSHTVLHAGRNMQHTRLPARRHTRISGRRLTNKETS